jgi:hypothetical protein
MNTRGHVNIIVYETVERQVTDHKENCDRMILILGDR